MKITPKSGHSVLAVALAIVASPLSLRAQDQPALDENLKPLQQYLGHWSVEIPTDKGRPETASATYKVVAGGKAIVCTYTPLTDSKSDHPEISVIYWQPETRSIAWNEFGPVSEHADSILTTNGSTMIWQGIDYNNEGRLESFVLAEEWKDNFTFIGQATHIISAGKVKPDSHKWIVKRVKDTGLQNDKEPSLIRKLKPLSHLLGKWTGALTNYQGEALNAVMTYKPAAGGAVIERQVDFKDKDGKSVASFVSIIAWHPETKAVVEHWFLSSGGHGLGVLTTGGRKVLEQCCGYTKTAFRTDLDEFDLAAPDTLHWAETQLVVGGQAKPDMQMTFKRVKQ